MSKEKAIKIYEKNRKALEKIFKRNSIKNLCVRDQSWLELHNWIVDLNQDYLYYEEKNGDDTLITNGVISSYIAKENRKETLEEKLDEYFLIEKDFKHQIKVGANGDAFCFDISLANTYDDDAEHFDKLTFEYESDELSEWLQKIADMLGIKDNDEFNLKSIENRIKEIGEPK
tara:strand:+ start:1016 stop:1534 length:519 start_codon:yes stop_codon:yes gene_type:complete